MNFEEMARRAKAHSERRVQAAREVKAAEDDQHRLALLGNEARLEETVRPILNEAASAFATAGFRAEIREKRELKWNVITELEFQVMGYSRPGPNHTVTNTSGDTLKVHCDGQGRLLLTVDAQAGSPQWTRVEAGQIREVAAPMIEQCLATHLKRVERDKAAQRASR